MGTWNVRILHEREAGSGESRYYAAEVHYDDGGVAVGYGSFVVEGEDLEEVLFYAEELAAAFSRGILEGGDAFPKPHENGDVKSKADRG